MIVAFKIMFVLLLILSPSLSPAAFYLEPSVEANFLKWKTERKQILESSESITRAIREEAQAKAAVSHALDEKTLEKAYQQFRSQFDPRFGGFGPVPKFPRSHMLSFLLLKWTHAKCHIFKKTLIPQIIQHFLKLLFPSIYFFF